MATKSNVLGRGLGNLIGGGQKATANQTNAEESSGVKEIRISEIKPNPNQPRKTFSQETISQLAETIKTHGVIQPIIVKKVDDGYELIAGERRLRACKEAGFVKIPAIVRNSSAKDSLELAILENIQREDLNPIEEAMAYQKLSEELNLKAGEIAARVGKSRSTIANLIRLLQLPETVKQLVANGKLTEGHARPLLSIGDKRKLEETAQKIVEQEMTVREVEDYVAKILGENKKERNSNKELDPSILEVETKIRNKFSTKVNIIHDTKTGKGKIIFSYANVDDMERLLAKLGIK